MKVYRDRIIKLDEFPVDENSDIFKLIIEQRKNKEDKDRFFLSFLPQDKLNEYNFNNQNSLNNFRNACQSIRSPLMRMGGYNMSPNHLNDDIRYAGIKMSDPYGNICGSFDIRNGIITYSPIFPRFYEERDLIKFANDEYFTTMTFEDIMLNQINLTQEFYVHTGDYYSLKDIEKYGKYILEKVSKDQMAEFVCNPNEGIKILKRNL